MAGVDVTREGRLFIDSINEFCGYKSRWLVKVDEPTDERYGVVPSMRGVKSLFEHGVVNLDKPPGPTSHEVVAWVKKLFGVDRAGHGGTLEPQIGEAGTP